MWIAIRICGLFCKPVSCAPPSEGRNRPFRKSPPPTTSRIDRLALLEHGSSGPARRENSGQQDCLTCLLQNQRFQTPHRHHEPLTVLYVLCCFVISLELLCTTQTPLIKSSNTVHVTIIILMTLAYLKELICCYIQKACGTKFAVETTSFVGKYESFNCDK